MILEEEDSSSRSQAPPQTYKHLAEKDMEECQMVEEENNFYSILHTPFQLNTAKHMETLMNYVWLLRKKIPSMPNSHIIEVLYSSTHESIILCHSRQVLGGLTFHQLEAKPVIELCLMASNQVRQGSGSFLVNYLKSSNISKQHWRR